MKMKECGNCGNTFEVSEKNIKDVGTAFGPEFRYICPECGSTQGQMKN